MKKVLALMMVALALVASDMDEGVKLVYDSRHHRTERKVR